MRDAKIFKVSEQREQEHNQQLLDHHKHVAAKTKTEKGKE